jgi:hypothetical protein
MMNARKMLSAQWKHHNELANIGAFAALFAVAVVTPAAAWALVWVLVALGMWWAAVAAVIVLNTMLLACSSLQGRHSRQGSISALGTPNGADTTCDPPLVSTVSTRSTASYARRDRCETAGFQCAPRRPCPKPVLPYNVTCDSQSCRGTELR